MHQLVNKDFDSIRIHSKIVKKKIVNSLISELRTVVSLRSKLGYILMNFWSQHCIWGTPQGRGSILDYVIEIFHWHNSSRSVSNGNEYQEYFLGGKGGRCVRLTTLPPPCAGCLEIWEPHPPGNLRVCSGLYRDLLYFLLLPIPRKIFNLDIDIIVKFHSLWYWSFHILVKLIR